MKPIIAITMGDPCGIGPEVIVKGLADCGGDLSCFPVVVGSLSWMQQAAARFAPGLAVRPIRTLSDAHFDRAIMNVLDPEPESFEGFVYGQPNPNAAMAAWKALDHAIDMALLGHVAGMTTGPIHKAQMHAIGFPSPGHTEYIANRAQSTAFGMMMVGGGLKITLATIHLPLKAAIAALQEEQLMQMIRLTDRALKTDFGLSDRHIAVAALNPHAGEGGRFGEEELRLILPAITQAKTEGLNVSGPYPADTLFYRLKQGQFDAAIALYHDQALIPIKVLAFDQAVNITLGLPFIRTSVDHGTAYDIAGKGFAHAGSLVSALHLAQEMAEQRLKTPPATEA